MDGVEGAPVPGVDLVPSDPREPQAPACAEAITALVIRP